MDGGGGVFTESGGAARRLDSEAMDYEEMLNVAGSIPFLCSLGLDPSLSSFLSVLY